MMILGLDMGEKRIGVAKTDELGMMAHAVGFVSRRTDKQAVAEIHKFVLEWKIQKVVIGLPKEMSGKVGKAADKVTAFGELIKQQFPEIELEYWDERLSTRAKERMLIDSDVSRQKRRKVIDALAAQEILQNYLDAHPRRFPAC